jgi:hypothetical protein
VGRHRRVGSRIERRIAGTNLLYRLRDGTWLITPGAAPTRTWSDAPASSCRSRRPFLQLFPKDGPAQRRFLDTYAYQCPVDQQLPQLLRAPAPCHRLLDFHHWCGAFIPEVAGDLHRLAQMMPSCG